MKTDKLAYFLNMLFRSYVNNDISRLVSMAGKMRLSALKFFSLLVILNSNHIVYSTRTEEVIY